MSNCIKAHCEHEALFSSDYCWLHLHEQGEQAIVEWRGITIEKAVNKKCKTCERLALFNSEFCWIHLEKQGDYAVNSWRKIVLDNKNNLQGAILVGADLSLDAYKRQGINVPNFKCTNLQIAYCVGTNLAGLNLHISHLQGCDLYEANLISTIFDYSDLQSSFLCGVMAEGSSFNSAELQCCNIHDSKFQNAHFHDAVLDQAQLMSSDFEGCDFSFAKMAGVDCTDANFNNANFEQAILTEAVLHGIIKGSKVIWTFSPHIYAAA